MIIDIVWYRWRYRLVWCIDSNNIPRSTLHCANYDVWILAVAYMKILSRGCCRALAFCAQISSPVWSRRAGGRIVGGPLGGGELTTTQAAWSVTIAVDGPREKKATASVGFRWKSALFAGSNVNGLHAVRSDSDILQISSRLGLPHRLC